MKNLFLVLIFTLLSLQKVIASPTEYFEFRYKVSRMAIGVVGGELEYGVLKVEVNSRHQTYVNVRYLDMAYNLGVNVSKNRNGYSISAEIYTLRSNPKYPAPNEPQYSTFLRSVFNLSNVASASQLPTLDIIPEQWITELGGIQSTVRIQISPL